jgi:small subunit ribosomal protein S5
MDNRNSQRFERQGSADGFEEKIVQVNRVSKKTQGGNKIGFAVLIVVGDKKGKVGVGLGKAGDVSAAIKKGVTLAKKHAIEVPIVNGTIPFEFYIKLGAAKVLLKPAPKGSGVIAGGAVRSVVSLAGIENISSKVLGTDNQASNVYATIEALQRLADRYNRERRIRKEKNAA